MLFGNLPAEISFFIPNIYKKTTNCSESKEHFWHLGVAITFYFKLLVSIKALNFPKVNCVFNHACMKKAGIVLNLTLFHKIMETLMLAFSLY